MATGFNFGAKTTVTPTFGTGSITFGTPAPQPQQFGFGNLSTSAPTLFGTQSTPTTVLGFKPTGFGAPMSTPSSGFAFGAAAPTFAAPAATTAATGFAFSTPAPSTGLTFGTPASTAAPIGLGFKPPTTAGLGFGPPASTGLSFATPASTGLNFGTPASTGINFGAPASSAPTFGTTMATPTTVLAFGPPTSTPATGNFGAAATSASTLGMGFGAPNTSAPAPSFGVAATSSGFSFGAASGGLGTLGNLVPISTSLGLTAASTAPQQSVGLGGVAFAQSKSGASSTVLKEPPPREQPLPNEFSQLVEQFKNMVQEEKNRSSDVSRSSVKEFCQVETDLDALNQQLSLVENQLLNNRTLAEKLKYDTAIGLKNIEIALRTQETPPSLQYDNTAPLQFFLDLADGFEQEMQQLKLKIDNTEKFVKKCNEPSILTSQDLAQGLKKLHETFVALAGRMQSVHSQIEAQKGIFVGLRKRAMKDNINPFGPHKYETINVIMNNALNATPPTLACGPTPFNSIALGSNNMTIAAQQAQATPFQAATTSSNLGFGLGNATSTFGSPAQNTSMFKPAGFGAATPFQMNTSSNFQLQKPPTGNKRGKQ